MSFLRYEDPSEEWKRRRALGIERRRAWVHERVRQPVNLPIALEEFLAEHRGTFTPRQLEALVWRYGHGLSLQEAADELGTTKSAFRKRLGRAERKLPDPVLKKMDHRDPGWERERERRRAEFEVEDNERGVQRAEESRRHWEQQHPEAYDPKTGTFLS
jgi:predicted DNA-binding protein (UPF0251 family)